MLTHIGTRFERCVSGIPSGCGTGRERLSGGIASLNHRLIAAIPPGWGTLALQFETFAEDPNDEPIENAVHRISVSRAEFEKSGRLRGDLVPIEPGEQTFILPQNWRWIRFGELANIVGGVTLGRNLGGRILGKFPYLRVANVQQGRLSLDVIKDIEIPVDELPKYRLESGDVLLTEGGDWDKLGRSAIWNGEIKNCLHQNHIFRARAFNSDVDSEWITLFTNSPVGRTYFQNAAKKTTNLASINMTQLRNCPIPLPPLAEQKRIVAKVDQLLALCDELAARQEARRVARAQLVGATLDRLVSTRSAADLPPHVNRLRTHFDHLFDTPTTIPQLRQTILQLAVQGQLVPQDPNEEPASMLRERLASRSIEIQNAGRSTRPKPLEDINSDTTPFELPNCWEWVRVGELAAEVEYGTSKKSSEIGGSVPVLRMNAIKDGVVSLDNLKYVPPTIDDLPRLYLKNGDILFNRTNSFELVGKTGVFKGPDDQFTFASYLIRARLLPEVVPEYVSMAINSQYFRRTQIEPEVTQQCGQANFNGTKLRNSLLPLPPLAEQKRIVAKVTELLSLCDTLEAQLQTAESASTQLLSATVASLLAAG